MKRNGRIVLGWFGRCSLSWGPLLLILRLWGKLLYALLGIHLLLVREEGVRVYKIVL